MYATPNNGQRARWQVKWKGKTGAFVTKDFEHDLAGALDLYTQVVEAGKVGATLRCCNMSFPPPDKFADHTPEFVVVKRRGKLYKKRVEPQLIEPRVYTDRMGKLNARGVWWCPYCLKLRRFVKKNYFVFEGLRVDEASMNCPVCDISHRDATIATYNPLARRYQNMRRTRSDKGTVRG